MSRNISPIQDLKSIQRLFQLFKSEKFDIVHTHSVKPGLLGRVAARLAGVPCILHTVHGLLLNEYMSRYEYWLWKISEQIGAMAGHYMVSQSIQDMQILIEKGICPKEKVGYLGNGIDLSVFDPSRISSSEVKALRFSLGVKDSDKVIAIVGRLLPDKGYFEFVEMARCIHNSYPNTKFWMIGRKELDRPDGIKPNEVITPEMGDYVNYLGFQEEMPLYYAAMDIFVLPSHHEGMPRSLMEAAAMGKAIVASDIRGCREVIQNQSTGILVPVRDVDALIDAIKYLLDFPDKSVWLATAAHSYSLLHFDEKSYLSRLEESYRLLLNCKGTI